MMRVGREPDIEKLGDREPFYPAAIKRLKIKTDSSFSTVTKLDYDLAV